jgi:hypothetical protein
MAIGGASSSGRAGATGATAATELRSTGTISIGVVTATSGRAGLLNARVPTHATAAM